MGLTSQLLGDAGCGRIYKQAGQWHDFASPWGKSTGWYFG